MPEMHELVDRQRRERERKDARVYDNAAAGPHV
jgi:hypothetical protein